MNHLCDRLWFIAALEHYTAVMGDFALNCSWDHYNADPTMADVFRWHGSEEVEHRSVAHDVAVYFHDSYVDRIGAMVMAMIGIYSFFQRGAWFLIEGRSDAPTSGGGRPSACVPAILSWGCCPNTESCLAPTPWPTFGPDSPLTRWDRPHRRSLIWPGPPPLARRIFDVASRPIPAAAAEPRRDGYAMTFSSA